MFGRVSQWESHSSGQAPTIYVPILLCRIRATTHARRPLHAYGGEDAVVGPVLVVLLVKVVVGAALLGAPVQGPVAEVQRRKIYFEI